jgi:putative ABC transport system permease protein
VLVLDDVYTLENNLNAFKNRVDNNPAVTSSSVSNFLPVPSNRNFSSFFKGKTPSVENSILIANWIVDFDYVETMGLEIINGRNFDKQLQTDSTAILINEELAAQLGYENPIGEFMSGLNFNENGEEDGATVYPIIGVYKNFHYASLRENIKAQALFIGSSRGALSIRLKNKDMTSFISQLEADWKEMAPNQPFSYQFLDSRFNRMFEAEQQLGKIASTFSFIAIFIACIGLLGLATFIAQQRTKEIGIRKVLGAQIPNLVYLLCKDFGKLILIAFLLASPISWYFMNKWLEDFAYATTIGVGGFLLAALLISLMAALSIIYQATRVALINPVDTLKSE